MPQAIGQTTLSYDGALALVGQDPQRIADSVKTVGDVLQYMIAARFGYDAPGGPTPPGTGEAARYGASTPRATCSWSRITAAAAADMPTP